jgi:hypothetical protein
MKKELKWWELLDEVAYICRLISSIDDKRKVEFIRDRCQEFIDGEWPTQKLIPTPKCDICGQVHTANECPRYLYPHIPSHA